MQTLVKIGKKPTKCKRRNHGVGHLYVITNPAWHGYCKIGRTTNLLSRFRTYQTASPFRDYNLYYYRWFNDVCLAERTLAQKLSGLRTEGEWYQCHPEDAANIIDIVANRLRSPRGLTKKEIRNTKAHG